MKLNVSSQSLGAVAPYVVSAVLLLPPASATVRASAGAVTEARVFVDVGQQIRPQSSVAPSIYTWDLDRPELAPSSLVKLTDVVVFEEYEPFTASEGWREVRDAKGPFVVEEDPKPAAFFDEYDLSAIALHGQQQ
jgi:hypothetical protein